MCKIISKESQLKSKRPLRVDKKEEKAKRVKAERDEARLNISKELQTQPYEKEAARPLRFLNYTYYSFLLVLFIINFSSLADRFKSSENVVFK
jgi:hypothetical protein